VSAAAHEPDPVAVSIDCPACDLDFDVMSDQGEAQHLAGVHNDLHHGGRREAAATVVDSDQAAPVAVAGLGWLVSAPVYQDACAQAVPYAGDESATDRAWSARVNAAVAGMDVLDPAGLDEWIDTHATSEVPHLVEAGLIAAWETHIRDVYDTAVLPQDSAEHDPSTIGLVSETHEPPTTEWVHDLDDVDAL
jgi:hypothetical protein